MVKRKNWLHICNGDSASHTLNASSIPGDVLPWRDVLHDGPVPSNFSLEELSEIRARYLASSTAFAFESIRRDFDVRDAHLQNAATYDEVMLWFEHDLYDQLQLIQLLDWFSRHRRGDARLSLICIDHFPEIVPFYGLGQLHSAQIESLFGTQRPVTFEQLDLGASAWAAFTGPDPRALEAFLRCDLTPLPYLKAAFARLLEEYPSTTNGLSRTALQILSLVADGIEYPVQLFAANQKAEEAPYLGDWGLWGRIAELCQIPSPLLHCEPDGRFNHPPHTPFDNAFRNRRLQLTDQGCKVLAESADWITLHGISRWFGGVHLDSNQPLWRWNPHERSLKAPCT